MHLSDKFPPRNRPDNKLGILDIHVVCPEGTFEFNPNSIIMAMLGNALPASVGVAPSVISGEPGLLYKTNEVEVALTSDELARLVCRALQPEEFFSLAKGFGIFHEIHDDFYDEETGEALQPVRAPLACLAQPKKSRSKPS